MRHWWVRAIPTFILVALVKKDYTLRSLGLKPDQMHWADSELFRRGHDYAWAVDFDW